MKQLFNHSQSERAQTLVSLSFADLYKIVRTELDYFNPDKSDPDAFCQDVCVRIEKAMGIFPNVEGLSPAPQQGDTATEQTGQKPGERAAQGTPADEQSGETSPVAQQGDAPAVDGWQPLDSAPKDQWLFLWVPGHGPARARWKDRMGWMSHTDGRAITMATHWRPMFASPAASKEGA